MKRISFLLVGALVTVGTAVAAPLTPDEALSRIGGSGFKAPGMNQARLLHTVRTETGSPAVYVFDRGEGSGYMILGADDTAYPVLGYADSGSLDVESLPPALSWWLGEYARQIQYASEHGVTAPLSSRLRVAEDRDAIEPMIKTHWDQGTPYNNQCPQEGTKRTYTGCVATSMAQVMNYWKYPERGTGSISYDAATIQKRLSMDFSKQPFDWANMADSYNPGQYTVEQANAVSYLMKACGYSVKMDYGADSSGALAMLIRNALVKYFKYDGNALYTLRMYYSASDWEKLIYDNLKNVGPILYGGDSMLGGGHSFVCDGYDGNGYFHFNWGWAGMSNGYYTLNALNPQALGAGGGTGGGYNFTQDAVLGIQPPTGDPVVNTPPTLTSMGALTSQISDGVLTFALADHALGYWVNYTATTLNVVLGARFENTSDPAAEPVIVPVTPLVEGVAAGDGVSKAAVTGCRLTDIDLADGSYKVSMMMLNHTYSKTEGEFVPAEEGWQPVRTLYAYPAFVTLDKKGSQFNVTDCSVPRLKVKSGEVIGDLYFGCTDRFSFTVANPNDMELTSGFAPVLYSAEAKTFAFIGESLLLTLPANGEVTHELTTDLSALSQSFSQISAPTQFYLTFMDEDTYHIYSDDILVPVTMHPNPGKPQVSLSSEVDVVNSVKSSTTRENIFTVANPSEIEVTAGVRLDKGYFSYPVMAALCTLGAGGTANIITYAGNTVILPNEGDTFDFNAVVAYPEADEDTQYYIMMVYAAGTQLYPIYGKKTAVVRFDPSVAGVTDVTDNLEPLLITYDKVSGQVTVISDSEVESIEVYTLDGAGVASVKTSDQLSLESCASGIYMVTARDTAGNVRTVKLVR